MAKEGESPPNGARRTWGHRHDRQEEPRAALAPRFDHGRKGEEGGGEERGECPDATVLTGRPGCADGAAPVVARRGEEVWEERWWSGLEN
jgi:hypothetical protein